MGSPQKFYFALVLIVLTQGAFSTPIPQVEQDPIPEEVEVTTDPNEVEVTTDPNEVEVTTDPNEVEVTTDPNEGIPDPKDTLDDTTPIPDNEPQFAARNVIYTPATVVQDYLKSPVPLGIQEITLEEPIPLPSIPETKEAPVSSAPENPETPVFPVDSPPEEVELALQPPLAEVPHDDVIVPPPTTAQEKVTTVADLPKVTQYIASPFPGYGPGRIAEGVRRYAQILPVSQLGPLQIPPPDHRVIFQNFRDVSDRIQQYSPNFFQSFDQLQYPDPGNYFYSALSPRNANPIQPPPFYFQPIKHFPTYESEFEDRTNGDGEYLKEVNFIEKALEVATLLNKVKGAFTPILTPMIEDTSGSNAVEICKLSKSRLIFGNAADAFSGNFVHFIKVDDGDKKCRFESFRALRVLEDALAGIISDLQGFPDLVEDLNETTRLIQAAIHSITLKDSKPSTYPVDPYVNSD